MIDFLSAIISQKQSMNLGSCVELCVIPCGVLWHLPTLLLHATFLSFKPPIHP